MIIIVEQFRSHDETPICGLKQNIGAAPNRACNTMFQRRQEALSLCHSINIAQSWRLPLMTSLPGTSVVFSGFGGRVAEVHIISANGAQTANCPNQTEAENGGRSRRHDPCNERRRICESLKRR
jgi:hypothetical protein